MRWGEQDLAEGNAGSRKDCSVPVQPKEREDCGRAEVAGRNRVGLTGAADHRHCLAAMDKLTLVLVYIQASWELECCDQPLS